jgi:hypothetical protein
MTRAGKVPDLGLFMAHPDSVVNNCHDRSSHRQRWINGSKLRLAALLSAVALATIVAVLGGDSGHQDVLDQDRQEARFIVDDRTTALATSHAADDINDPNEVKLDCSVNMARMLSVSLA